MGQAHGLANLFILLSPALGMIGLLVILNAARNAAATTSLTLYALGFALFLVAKLSLIRHDLSPVHVRQGPPDTRARTTSN